MPGRWQGFRRSHKLSPSRPRASISAPQLAEMMRSRTAASDWSGDAATPILVKAAKSRTASILIQNEHRKWVIGSGSPPWNVAARLVPWLCLRFAWVSIAVGQQRHLLSKRGRGAFPPLLWMPVLQKHLNAARVYLGPHCGLHSRFNEIL
jgi:hypothetical protein